MKKILLPILVLVFVFNGLGQNTFEKNFSGYNQENNNPRNIQKTPDEGFVIVGTRLHDGIDNVFLSKLNQQGDTLWIKYYFYSGISISVNDLEVLDDGYIFICDVNSVNLSNFVIRTDLNGEIIWSKSYSESFPIRSNKIIQSEEGGFMISGTVKSDTDSLKNAVCAIKIDSNGGIEWGKKYNNISTNNYTPNFFKNIGVTEINTSYYLINNENILKINSIGDTLGIIQFYYYYNFPINQYLKTTDNKLIIALKNNEYDAVLKIDTNLTINWTKNIGHYDDMNCLSLNNTNDGGILVGWYGSDYSNYGNYGSTGFSKLDSLGNSIFNYSRNKIDRISRVISNPNGSYTFVLKYSAHYLSDFIQTSIEGTGCTNTNTNNIFYEESVDVYPVYQNLTVTSAFTNTNIPILTRRLNGLVVSICNSTTNLNSTDSVLISACGSYTLNNQNYTQSGFYTNLIPNIDGTFDTLSFVLNIIPNTSYTEYISACTYYQLPTALCDECGMIYNSGIYNVYEYQNVSGCDSIVKYDITITQPTINNTSLTVCDSFNLDNYHLTTSGLYTLYTDNSMGCDSIINLNLTVLHSTSSSFTDTSYEFYTFYGQTYTQSGPYTHTLTNSIGCDSNITVDLTILYIDTTIMVDSLTLTAIQPNATYQWIDCNLDSYIPGANEQSYTVSENGVYAVEITLENATKKSECVTINILDVTDIQLENNFNIFPNPFTSEAKIVFNVPQTNTEIQLLDVLGNELQTMSFSGTEYTLYRESLSASMYFVQITDASGKVATRKLVLE